MCLIVYLIKTWLEWGNEWVEVSVSVRVFVFVFLCCLQV